jgi:hypothetical protein
VTASHDAKRGVTLCAILRVPAEGVALFRAYEDAVLPLLSDHGGTLQRRLRSSDGTTEIHVIRFPQPAQLEAYRADSRRAAHADLFARSGATAELLMVEEDV